MSTRLPFALFLLAFATPAALAQDTAPSKFSIWLPGRAWALEIEAPGFTLRVNAIQPDGRRYFLAENAKSRAALSVYLEAGKAPATTEDCKRALENRAQGNAPFSRKNIVRGEVSGIETYAFTISEVDGVPLNQRNIFACLVKDDVFADIHLSKMFFKAADQPWFDAILQSARIVAKEPVTAPVPVGNSVDLLREGSRFYLARQYREAIGPYQKALDIEKVAPTLDKNLWRVLVDHLGMSYGITGDLARAKEVLEYGVSQDSTYPMFYYSLACVAAEKGDEGDTKEFLKLAFEYRNNMIPGERFPDPRVDDSFQRLLLEKEFREWVNALFARSE